MLDHALSDVLSVLATFALIFIALGGLACAGERHATEVLNLFFELIFYDVTKALSATARLARRIWQRCRGREPIPRARARMNKRAP